MQLRARTLHKLGGHSDGETPLPIPNREVKPVSADGTRGASPRESRTPPISFEEPLTGALRRYREAIDRFAVAASAEQLVLAAFLGGSYAAGRATETSDLDVYVIARRQDYEALWAKRAEFIADWGEVVILRDLVDFEGLGFDMVQFELADGVHGELAFGHTDNFMVIHGGPYEVLVDREGLLDGVEFPLL